MAEPHASAKQAAVEHATPLQDLQLQLAALQADVRALVAYLLDQNPENGDTPVMAALCNPHVARLLLEHGADPNAAPTEDGATALHLASQDSHEEVVRLLLEHKADPNLARADDRTTALHIASEDGHVEVVRLLLEHKADPNLATTNAGTTALHLASEDGHVEVVRLLLEHKADPNSATTDDGTTALYMASQAGHVAVVRLLLEHKADPDPNLTTTNDGTTALHKASKNGHVVVVHLLAVHGAILDHATNHGSTAQQMATLQGHNQLANWLAAVTNHTLFQIAIGCRMHAEARSLLCIGALGDPTRCRLAEVVQVATGTTAWGTGGVAMPPVCPTTTRLARAAMKCWSPVRHWLFHGQFREAVLAVLLVQERLGRRAARTSPSSSGATLPSLPDELWLLVCAMLLRRDWGAQPRPQ